MLKDGTTRTFDGIGVLREVNTVRKVEHPNTSDVTIKVVRYIDVTLGMKETP